MRAHHSRLIAASHQRQVYAVERADAVADAADRTVGHLWRQLLDVLAGPRNYHLAYEQSLHIFRQLVPSVIGVTAEAFRRMARWGWKTSTSNIIAHAPKRMLQAAAYQKERRGVRPVYESRQLFEAEPEFDYLDLLFPWRGTDWSSGERIPENEWLSLLFPPPSPELVNATVFSSGWVERLAAGSKLGDPAQMAATVATGMMLGHSQQDIARAPLPLVDGVRTSARRVARTEGLRICQAQQMHAAAELGDLVIGYRLIAVLDTRSRSWHAHRNGRVYYIHPEPGQSGLYKMPNPPDEPQDPAERPAGTPQTAPNCRCGTTVVLRPLEGNIRAELDALGEPAHAAPDQMDDWFRAAPVRQRRIAVGAHRYNAARGILGHEPEWHELIRPSGELLTVPELEQESAYERMERLQNVRTIVANNRANVEQLRRYGALVT